MAFKVGDLVALGPVGSTLTGGSYRRILDRLQRPEWRGVVRAVNGGRITVFWLNDGSAHTVGNMNLYLLKEVQGDNETSKGPFAP